MHAARRTAVLALVPSISLALGLVAAGCGTANGGTSAFGNGSSGGRGGGGAGGSGGGGVDFDAGGGGGGELTDANACAATATKAQRTPLDMFIMLDQSGSMRDSASGETKWQAVTNGITAFVNDPAAADIGVGLQFFGLPAGGGGGRNGDSCKVADYATAAVPIATLPGNATAMVNALMAHSPGTKTPSAPALQGALQFASSWQQANADHTTVVVFATDGDPTECSPQDVGGIAAIAAGALAATPSIRTFVIGMAGATTSNLDAWAAAGGSGQSYNANDTAAFVAALDGIRGQALTCEYQIPTPQSGALDYTLVNVQFTQHGQATTLPQVADASACDPATGGWYYDVPQAPTHIEICASTCDVFKRQSQQTGSDAEVDILLGCQTITGGAH